MADLSSLFKLLHTHAEAWHRIKAYGLNETKANVVPHRLPNTALSFIGSIVKNVEGLNPEVIAEFGDGLYPRLHDLTRIHQTRKLMDYRELHLTPPWPEGAQSLFVYGAEMNRYWACTAQIIFENGIGEMSRALSKIVLETTDWDGKLAAMHDILSNSVSEALNVINDPAFSY